MLDRSLLEGWIVAYERAWRTEGTEALAQLFAQDATYSTAPFEPAFSGLEAIARMWEDGRESPDESFRMEFEVVAVEDEVGVVRVDVAYDGPPRRRYRDLWIVRFDDDFRCVAFEEWPFWPRGSAGTYAPGPTA